MSSKPTVALRLSASSAHTEVVLYHHGQHEERVHGEGTGGEAGGGRERNREKNREGDVTH